LLAEVALGGIGTHRWFVSHDKQDHTPRRANFNTTPSRALAEAATCQTETVRAAATRSEDAGNPACGDCAGRQGLLAPHARVFPWTLPPRASWTSSC
jgi:hypothetical protein